MNKELLTAIQASSHVSIIQAENPDGDSLGSALALEDILTALNKQVTLYCPVDIPKYLRYFTGWDRVSDEFDYTADLYIIVDTASKTLLDKALTPEATAQLNSSKTIVIDHHDTESDLPFTHTLVSDSTAVATGEIIYHFVAEHDLVISQEGINQLLGSILSDSLGLMSEAVTPGTVTSVAALLERGGSIARVENARRQFMKKKPEILSYKGQLLQRVEYYLDNQLAVVHVPWEEIEKYSDSYNPGALVIDEMRLVEGVKLAVVLKTYPDGKLTGKLRANPEAKIAETVASYFGGGGHKYAAGFRVYENIDKILQELITATDKALKDYDQTV